MNPPDSVPPPVPPPVPTTTPAMPPAPPVPPLMQPGWIAQAGAVTPDDRSNAMLCHLLSIFTGFIAPLIIWLVKKDQSRFIDHHGRENLNFQITMIIFLVGLIGMSFVFMILPFAFFLIPVLYLAAVILPLVFEIQACMAANRGEWYRYPLCIRIL